MTDEPEDDIVEGLKNCGCCRSFEAADYIESLRRLMVQIEGIAEKGAASTMDDRHAQAYENISQLARGR